MGENLKNSIFFSGPPQKNQFSFRVPPKERTKYFGSPSSFFQEGNALVAAPATSSVNDNNSSTEEESTMTYSSSESEACKQRKS